MAKKAQNNNIFSVSFEDLVKGLSNEKKTSGIFIINERKLKRMLPRGLMLKESNYL